MSLPKSSGYHKIECNTWSPIENWKHCSLQFFMNNQPQILNQSSQENSVSYSILTNDEKRSQLVGVSNGKILLEVEVRLVRPLLPRQPALVARLSQPASLAEVTGRAPPRERSGSLAANRCKDKVIALSLPLSAFYA